MTSSYYPITTDNFFDSTQSKSMAPTSHYSSYPVKKTSDDEDDDLDALRKAALKTLYSKKRKNNYDHSPIHRNSRSSSRSYSSSSSRSSYTHSSISRSYSSSSLSSISSNSLDKNDKDYRFELKEKQSTTDIDERFPKDIPNDNDDMLIVNCPIQDDDDLILHDEQKNSKIQVSKKTSDYDERNNQKKNSKEIKQRKEERKKSPSIEQPISITVKLNNSDEFDLRQLIKKRRTDESSLNNHRTVQILPKDNDKIVHKTIHDRLSSGRSEKNSTLKKYHKH